MPKTLREWLEEIGANTVSNNSPRPYILLAVGIALVETAAYAGVNVGDVMDRSWHAGWLVLAAAAIAGVVGLLLILLGVRELYR